MGECYIQPAGINPNKCGYCHSDEPSSISFGFVSESMRVELYEGLMLKGWRRCGNYFYRSVHHKTCCPMYTIRLRASAFFPSKSQKKVMKNAEKYFSSRNLDISLVSAEFSEEKFSLYRIYQITIHDDEEDKVTKEGFKNFLVQSPLTSDEIHETLGLKYGTYHQEYRCDGHLFAVGVLDILPSGISSVYFFYDPDFKFLAPGKFSALKEIKFCQNKLFDYYYMGYYIHSCEKMKYKGEYKPSELLCPVTSTWHDLAGTIDKLDRFKFTPFDQSAYERREILGTEDSSQLDQLFPSIHTVDISQTIPIYLSDYKRKLRLLDLTRRGQEILGKVLLELATYVPSEYLQQLIVSI